MWPKYDPKWPQMAQNGPRMTQNDPKWPKMTQNDQEFFMADGKLLWQVEKLF